MNTAAACAFLKGLLAYGWTEPELRSVPTRLMESLSKYLDDKTRDYDNARDLINFYPKLSLLKQSDGVVPARPNAILNANVAQNSLCYPHPSDPTTEMTGFEAYGTCSTTVADLPLGKYICSP